MVCWPGSPILCDWVYRNNFSALSDEYHVQHMYTLMQLGLCILLSLSWPWAGTPCGGHRVDFPNITVWRPHREVMTNSRMRTLTITLLLTLRRWRWRRWRRWRLRGWRRMRSIKHIPFIAQVLLIATPVFFYTGTILSQRSLLQARQLKLSANHTLFLLLHKFHKNCMIPKLSSAQNINRYQ